jgi:hypothetical protein
LKKKNSNIIFLTNFVIINLGLDLEPDWIRIQQQAGSGKYLDPDSVNTIKLLKNAGVTLSGMLL